MDRDVVIIGSGFGGSVAALRLAEKGHRVLVLEQGLRIDASEIDEAKRRASRLVWEPRLGFRGYFAPRIFRHVAVLTGVGVGGGSLVYAAVLLRPGRAFFEHPAWSGLGVDWERELGPKYDLASRMLGLATTPTYGRMDEYLRRTASAMGAGASYGPTPNAIYFGGDDARPSDPYFDGRGPMRRPCTRCGECITGCSVGAKNSLDKNYLHLAEARGAEVRPRSKVTHIVRIGGGYRVHLVDPLGGGGESSITATRVILAAGVLGTLEILFRSRDVTRTLPALSPALGRIVRTNSEAIVGILSREGESDLSREGATISSHFYADAVTHITQNRMSEAAALMRFQLGPLIDDARPHRRAWRALGAMALAPRRTAAAWRARDWHRRMTMLTVMQHADNCVAFEWRRGLRSAEVPGKQAPSYLPVANEAARAFARVSGGEPLGMLFESVGQRAITAHVLGGCPIASGPDAGVIDSEHQVFGYPGLYVVDASAIPANVGVNPSLTITALAERAMDHVPPPTEGSAQLS